MMYGPYLSKSKKTLKMRRCWRCKIFLNHNDLIRENYPMKPKRLIELWENPYIEFYCCSCYHELRLKSMYLKK